MLTFSSNKDTEPWYLRNHHVRIDLLKVNVQQLTILLDLQVYPPLMRSCNSLQGVLVLICVKLIRLLSPSFSTSPYSAKTRMLRMSTFHRRQHWVVPVEYLAPLSQPPSQRTRHQIWWTRSGPSRTRSRDSWSKEFDMKAYIWVVPICNWRLAAALGFAGNW